MLPLMLGMDTMVVDTDTEDTTVDTMATLTDTVTTEARGLPHLNPKPMLMPKLPLMPGTDTTVWDTVTTDTVTTDTDTVCDTVDTTDTDIPVLTDTTDTTLARGLLMPNLKPKPKLIPLLMLGTDITDTLDITGMAEDTMVDTMDTVTDMDTDTTVKKLF